MGNRLIKILVFVSIIVFTSCETLDFRSMIISYESVNSRFEQSEEWNTQHPFREINTITDNYTIISLSDCHVGGTENLDTVLNRAVNLNATAVVMVGDLTTGKAEDYEIFNQHISNFNTLELFSIVGNHELFFNGWEQFYSIFGSSTYLFTVKTPDASDLYICIDTGSGTLGTKQMSWLKNILKTERNNYRHCVLFTHNNLFQYRHTLTTNPMIEELRVLLELFIEYRVEMVVTGHDHKKASETLGNTTHITLDALVDYNEDAGYLEININDNNIEHRFINL